MPYRRASPLSFPLALILILVAACGDSKETSSPERTPAATPEQAPSAREGLTTWRPLLDEAPRAELDVGGLLIDMGGPDQLKYTRGDWGTGWGASDLDTDGVTFTAVPGRSAKLELQLSAPALEVAVRMRSAVEGQRMSVLVDGKAIGNGDIGADWSIVKVPVSGDALAPGRHEISLQLGSSAKEARAEVDWVWLRSEADAPPVGPLPRVVPVALGKRTRRALPAATSRTYTFYMHVPPQGALVFDYGADEQVEFSVSAATDGAGAEELFRAGAKRNTWTEAKVDLSKYAGKAVRLALTTDGPPGKAGWGEPEIMVPKAEVSPLAGGAPPRNVVIVLIDTVRGDAFKALNGETVVHAPAFDAFAAEAALFEHAYNNENWTKPSVATTLSGLYPVTHDTKKDPSVLPDEVELLSERLKREGFATAGFVANGFVSDKFGFEQGWDLFRNYIRENRKSEAEFVYRDALEWIDAHKQGRFFAYIQTIDPHVTYKVDRAYTDRYYPGTYSGPLGSTVSGGEQADASKGKLKLGEDDIAWLKALYFGEITYHDEHFGLFVDALRERNLLDDTLFIVMNDHGEELGEHGRYGHGHSLYEELLRSPLAIRYPPMFGKGRHVKEVVEHVDVAPTIVDALGMAPLEAADGASLMPLMRGEPVSRPYYAVAEFLEGRRSIRVGRFKMERSSGDRVRLYDLSEDPGEQKDLTETHPIARRLCDVYLGEALASPDKSQRLERPSVKRRFEAGEAKIDPMLRQQLEALGYFGG